MRDRDRSQRHILYITYNHQDTLSARHINAELRKKALERIGFSVDLFSHTPGYFMRDFRRVLRSIPKIHCFIIRIDGTGILDKFTLVKLWNRNTPILWEVHGFPEENAGTSHSPVRGPSAFSIIKSTARRKLLSTLTDGYLSISEELMRYARLRIAAKQYFTIPNFIDERSISDKNIPQSVWRRNMKLVQEMYTVLWMGNARLPWHALDRIEAVAREIYRRDPSVYFVILGTNPWHRFTWRKNIRFVGSLPRNEALLFVKNAQVCLALYNKPKLVPLYFSPLKLLDYMSMKKPIVATGEGSIRTIIQDGANGLLTDNSIPDVTQKILYLKNNERIARKLGENAWRTVSTDFSFATACDRYERALHAFGLM
jgi:glycosyltransferase involved in cell wall biosynthesis